MTDRPAEDPIRLCILEMVADGRSPSPQDVARAFFEGRRRPKDPPDGWRRYLPAVKQQAVSLARQGRIEITRKGEAVDPEDFKGLVRLRLAVPQAV